MDKLQPPEAAILSILEPEIAGKRILDIGVGGGRTTRYLTGLSRDYIGIDYSPRMIQRCRQIYPNVRFKECDARDLSAFPSASFDFVMFSFNGIDYVDHAGRLKILAEIRRVLADDGVFVFSSHNRDTRVRRSWELSHFVGTHPVITPLRFTKRAILYSLGIMNSLKNTRNEEQNETYALMNDECHEYSLMTYYISVPKQIEQVEEAGFKVTHVYGLDGQQADYRSSTSLDPWIYYLCRASNTHLGA
nr:class I SAM-dependent methyltransferase [Microvirga mediterraneensis]